MTIRQAGKQDIPTVVAIHLATFPGFFLTFLGPGFLRLLYQGFLEHKDSQLLCAIAPYKNDIMGFAAWSNDISGLYRQLIKTRLFPLAWYAFLGFLKKPSAFFRLLRALKQPADSSRDDAYAILSSIGTHPQYKRRGVGSALLGAIKGSLDPEKISYLMLETDARDNEAGQLFYQNNGFALAGSRTTKEGRQMLEYRFYPSKGKGA